MRSMLSVTLACCRVRTYGQTGSNYAEINPYDTSNSDGLVKFVTDRLAAPLGSADNKVQAYNFRLCVTKNPNNSVPFPKPSGYNRSDWAILYRLANTTSGNQLSRYVNNAS